MRPMKNPWRWLAPLLLASVTLAQEPDPAASRAAVRRGSEHFQAKRYEDAVGAFREALAHWPDNATALNDLAWLLLTAEDEAFRAPAEALALAERAVALAPDRHAFLDTLATAYDHNGLHLEAARLQRRAVELDPGQAFYGEQLERFAVHALDRPGEAAQEAELRWLLGLGRLTRAQGVEGEARADLLRAAVASLEAAVTLAPGHGRAHAALGRALEAVGKKEDALAAVTIALRLGAGSSEPGLARRRGALLLALGRTAEAADALDRAVVDAPGDFDLRHEAARAWRAVGDPARVAATVRAAARAMTPDVPLWATEVAARLHLLEAEAWEAKGDRAGALAALVRSVAARTTDDALDARIQAHAAALGRKEEGPALRHALAAEVLGQRGVPRFTDVTDEVLPPGVGGSRVALVDVDGDGFPDLLINGCRLLLNDGTGKFRDVTAEVGLAGLHGAGGVLADVDRDGDLDLYVISHAPRGDRLLENRSTPGAPRFVDVTERVGVPGGMTDDLPTEGAAWGDLNGDGYPDLYVANYELPGEPLRRGTPDRLYLSDGKGGFVDASERVRTSPPRCGRGVVIADFDQDGDVDVLVANYRLDPDLLWVNDGRGRLTEEAHARGVAGVEVDNAWGHSIGAAFGDLDLDGQFDLVVASLAHPRFIHFSDKTKVYLQRDGRFRDARAAVGLHFEETHSNPTLFDADDDGDLDLFLTAIYPGRPSSLWLNRLGDDGDPRLRFDDVAWTAGVRVYNGWGAAVADLDGDGDLDLVVMADGRARVFRNDGLEGRRHRSVRLRLVGTRSDTWGAGATCTLIDGRGRRLVRQVSLGSGTGCQDEPIVHFGVGETPGPFSVTVRWPSGVTSEVAVGPGLHRVVEPGP